MVNQQGSPFYKEDAIAMQRSHQRIVSTFPHQQGVPGPPSPPMRQYWTFGFASKKYHPINDLDAPAWEA